MIFETNLESRAKWPKSLLSSALQPPSAAVAPARSMPRGPAPAPKPSSAAAPAPPAPPAPGRPPGKPRPNALEDLEGGPWRQFCLVMFGCFMLLLFYKCVCLKNVGRNSQIEVRKGWIPLLVVLLRMMLLLALFFICQSLDMFSKCIISLEMAVPEEGELS